VVGVNRFVETAPSPLTGDTEMETILKVDALVEATLKEEVAQWRRQRDEEAVTLALAELVRVAKSSDPADNIMVPSIALAHAGGTTGEWAGALREVFGEY